MATPMGAIVFDLLIWYRIGDVVSVVVFFFFFLFRLQGGLEQGGATIYSMADDRMPYRPFVRDEIEECTEKEELS